MQTAPPATRRSRAVSAENKQRPELKMMLIPVALAVIAAGVAIATRANNDPSTETPAQAQFIDQRAFNVLPYVAPPSVFNGTTPFTPPGYDLSALLEKPFHVYDDEFYDVIGPSPSLTLIAHSDSDPIFHEAVVWYPPTNEVFFAQNAGAPAAGTGLNKSSVVLKISLQEAESVTALRNATGKVQVQVVDSNPMVINPNGGINYKGQLLFAAEGQGADRPSELIMVNPLEPYNATVLLNNYFGRQFNSLNDISINPRNSEIYFVSATPAKYDKPVL
ncbi:hypothetical protein F5Y18DRAFT_44931 [Xylariaceae sp. FL1019]|nr:hypothetical protein F5Y18DRAFT_44931 [Xylariaceae sp. FL1019]